MASKRVRPAQGAIPKTRADLMAQQMEECLKELRVLAILVGGVGRPVLANQQLLVHWATRDETFGSTRTTSLQSCRRPVRRAGLKY
jgi:hypothetical protein